MEILIKDCCIATIGNLKYNFIGHTWQADGLECLVDTLIDGVDRGISSIRIIGSNTTRVADNWSDNNTSNVYHNYATWDTTGSINAIQTIQIMRDGTLYSQQTCTSFEKPSGVELRIEWRSTVTGDWVTNGEVRIAQNIAGNTYVIDELILEYNDTSKATITPTVSKVSNTIVRAEGTFPSAASEKTVDWFFLEGTIAGTWSQLDITDFIEPLEASVSVVWDSTFSAG